MLAHRAQEARSVVDRSDNLVVNLGQQPNETLSKQHRVIGHHHPHAAYAATFPELSEI
jgi:predicted NodU family carbamoyl transferase